jgi:hypothetical protein
MCGQACTRDRTAQLHDRRQVCTWCEEWRAECEALTLLRMPHVDARRGYLIAVGKRRGLKARNALEERARAIWKARRSAAA